MIDSTKFGTRQGYYEALIATAAKAGVPVVCDATEEMQRKFASDACADYGRAKARANGAGKIGVTKELSEIPRAILSDYQRLVQLTAFENLYAALERAEKAARAAFASNE
jgi:hypothetical protein